ncbi:MAG: glycosyltransferase [Anaerolineales bacterium]|nr:glycosyltransferase [Anaerolineales bacterium]MCB9144264.1 glycosyltransferase [Anaerolineales bacterium]
MKQHQSSGQNLYQKYLWGFRILAFVTVAWGTYYLIWRYTNTLNFDYLWLALLLVLAETYSYADTLFFTLMMWKPTRREAPPPADDDASVDVYIATYNEPVELLRLTAEASMKIDWQNKRVYILDDGSRKEMKALADEIGCGYITRSEDWSGKPRHAKAGNINNAIQITSGEFILILDADQIPAPAIIRNTLRYFEDPKVAFVQTPQYYYNLPPGDPFASDAPLFYGPILQGKDGWNAATFCGSNAILRREALMQLGLSGYVKEAEEQMAQSMLRIQTELSFGAANPQLEKAALKRFKARLRKAHKSLKEGESLFEVSDVVRKSVQEAQESVANNDFEEIARDLEILSNMGDASAEETQRFITFRKSELAAQTAPNAGEALGISNTALKGMDLTRADEAIPILPLSTVSITEDTATAMRLHAMGWMSVFHGEILAYGLAPEDLGTALAQRLRWAQGTLQILVRENPLFYKGLTIAQRFLYFNMAYSYFSGFINLIFLLVPIFYLLFGFSAVSSWSIGFVARLLPVVVLTNFLHAYVTHGLNVRRSEEYSLALFPLWIQAVISVFSGMQLKFSVTPKQRQSGNYLRLVWPQMTIVAITIFASIYGLVSLWQGWNTNVYGVLINVFWGIYNTLPLSRIIRAAVYVPPADWQPRPPDFIFPQS